MNRKKFAESRRKFKEDALKDKAAFIAQGSRKCLVEMRYFRELCLREIDWCRTQAKRKKTDMLEARRMKDTKKIRAIEGELLLCGEISRIRRRESASVRELIDMCDFGGFLKFLERLE